LRTTRHPRCPTHGWSLGPKEIAFGALFIKVLALLVVNSETGRIVLSNKAAERLLGSDADKLAL